MKKSFFILFALVLVLMSCSKSQSTEQNEAEEKISIPKSEEEMFTELYQQQTGTSEDQV